MKHNWNWRHKYPTLNKFKLLQWLPDIIYSYHSIVTISTSSWKKTYDGGTFRNEAYGFIRFDC